MAVSKFPPETDQVSGGYYYDNLVAIGQYLEANGYSRAAAAGVAGTIAGESAGNPESVGSGGAGLIGWTPPDSAGPIRPIVTGNRTPDWQHQLTDLLAYADANSQEAINRGGVDLATFKRATDPLQAARWWSEFEGPLVPGSDIRNEVVQQVFTDLATYTPNGNWTQPAGAFQGSSSQGGGAQNATLTSATTCAGVTVFGHCIGVQVPSLSGIMADITDWLERLGLFILGGIFVIMGLYIMVRDTGPVKSAEKTVKGNIKNAVKGSGKEAAGEAAGEAVAIA